MSETSELAKRAAKDFRFMITVSAAFVLGLLLLFLKDATAFMRETLVPSLAIYTVGTGVIAGVQTLLATWRDGRYYLELKASNNDQNKTKARPGVTFVELIVFIVVHIVWFLLFCWYNLAKI